MKALNVLMLVGGVSREPGRLVVPIAVFIASRYQPDSKGIFHLKVLTRVAAVVALTAFGISTGLVAEAAAWGTKTVTDDGVSEGRGKGTVGINSTDIGGHNQRYDLRPGGNSIYTVSEFWMYGKWCIDGSGKINCWLRSNPQGESPHTTAAEWSDHAAYREKLNSGAQKGRVITWVAKDKSLQPDPMSAKTTQTFTWP